MLRGRSDVAHIFWSFTVGGAETMTVDLINKQVAEGLKVDLLVINDHYDQELLAMVDCGAQTITLNRRRGSLSFLAFLVLNHRLIFGRYSVIHCHSETLHRVIAPWLHSKLVLTVHGFHRLISSANPYFAVVGVSHAVAASVTEQGVRNCLTIPNGVHTEKIRPKSEFNKCLRFVCLGRLDHRVKCQDLALRAFAHFSRLGFPSELYFVGEGTSQEFLSELAVELGVNDKVFFLGAQSRDEVYGSLANYDISMQLSRHEGFGLAALESMAACVPLIISTADGLIEITREGHFAYVSKDWSTDAVLERILEIKKAIDFGDIHSKLEQSCEFAKNNFDLAIMHLRYLELYGLVGTRRFF